MTITPKQQRAAGRELRLRRIGGAEQEVEGQQTRPFGSTDEEIVRRFAKGPTDEEVEEMAAELEHRDAGRARRLTSFNPDRPHGMAQTGTLRHWVNRRASK